MSGLFDCKQLKPTQANLRKKGLYWKSRKDCSQNHKVSGTQSWQQMGSRATLGTRQQELFGHLIRSTFRNELTPNKFPTLCHSLRCQSWEEIVGLALIICPCFLVTATQVTLMQKGQSPEGNQSDVISRVNGGWTAKKQQMSTISLITVLIE